MKTYPDYSDETLSAIQPGDIVLSCFSICVNKQLVPRKKKDGYLNYQITWLTYLGEITNILYAVGI